MSYIYNLTDTWDAAGTTFAGIKMAVTNTASGASSKLLDLTISGATTGAFSIDKSGNASVSGALTLGTALTVGNGGTGTSTAFTAGSIVFAGASGVYSQNNTKLFWDNTNSRLGIGFGSPAYTFDIIGADLGATAGNTSLLGRYFSQTGNGESLQILYSRTASSPTNWTTASLILRREVSGTIQQALQFNGDASTTINHGTNELFRVNSNGNLLVGTTVTGGGKVCVKNTPTSQWGIDFNEAVISVANGSNAAIPAGSGMIVITDATQSGSTAMYIMGAVTVALASTVSGTFVAPTTTPGAGTASIQFNTGSYRIYNNIGQTINFKVAMLRTRDSN